MDERRDEDKKKKKKEEKRKSGFVFGPDECARSAEKKIKKGKIQGKWNEARSNVEVWAWTLGLDAHSLVLHLEHTLGQDLKMRRGWL